MSLARRHTKPLAPLFVAALTALLLGACPASAATFTNATPISVPGNPGDHGNRGGPGSLYPSEISVSGMTGPITDVNVTLQRVGHNRPSDITMVLVSPSGDTVKLMTHNCGASTIEDDILILDQQAPRTMPRNGSPCDDITFRPDPEPDLWDPVAPAPAGPHGTSLDDFNSESPNGTWRLYVADHQYYDDIGDIEQGWTLTLATGSSSAAIPGSGSSGQANPYPVTRTVSGLAGIVTDVNVVQDGIWHERPDDLDLLLVGPRGQKVVLMSDACGSYEMGGYGFVWDDEAAFFMPDGDHTNTCGGRFQRPTNFDSGDVWPGPAPAGPYSSRLSAFDLTDPNGEWRLYIQDDTGDKVGFFTSLFQLNIVTRPKASVAFTESAVTLAEGSSRTLTLGRSGPATPAAGAVTVSTVPASAGSGTDFEPVSSTVQFAPGETEKTVSVGALTDGVDETDENFVVSLSSPSGDALTAAPASVTVTIPGDAVLPPEGGGGPPATRNDAVGFGPDTLVTLRLAKRRIPSRGPVRASIVNGNAFAITGSLSGRTAKRVAAAGKRKHIRLRGGSFEIGANVRGTVRLKLPAKLRRLLRRKRKLALRLSANVVDPVGSKRTVSRKLTPRLSQPRNRKGNTQ